MSAAQCKPSGCTGSKSHRNDMSDFSEMAAATALKLTPAGSGPRLLLYSHDGHGLGHTRRNLAIAAAITELAPDAAVLIVTGTNEVHRLGVPTRVSVLKLPGWRKIGNERNAGRGPNAPRRDS